MRSTQLLRGLCCLLVASGRSLYHGAPVKLLRYRVAGPGRSFASADADDGELRADMAAKISWWKQLKKQGRLDPKNHIADDEEEAVFAASNGEVDFLDEQGRSGVADEDVDEERKAESGAMAAGLAGLDLGSMVEEYEARREDEDDDDEVVDLGLDEDEFVEDEGVDRARDARRRVNDDDGVRVQKLLAAAGMCSRREAEKLIADGRVRVDGKLITKPGTKAKHTSAITVDGMPVVQRDKSSIFWCVVHKPKGVVVTMEDDLGRKTISDLVPRARELRLVPVGRLDRDTSGVVLLTNDNEWVHKLSHPAYGHLKRYRVVVKNGPVEPDVYKTLRQGGLFLEGEERPLAALPVAQEISFYPDTREVSMELILREGRNRQIRRMMDQLGHPVRTIVRTAIGPIGLGSLKAGEWRTLKKSEVVQLKSSSENSPTTRTGSGRGRARRRFGGRGSRGRRGRRS